MDSVAIPGEIAGLSYAHQRYGSGKLSWADLVAPAIKLAKEGTPIPESMGSLLKVRSPSPCFLSR